MTQVKWYESGKLTVEFELPEEGKTLIIQGVNIVDNKGVKTSGTGSYTWQRDGMSDLITKSLSEFEVEKRASYDMEFEFPGYLIPSEMETELELKK